MTHYWDTTRPCRNDPDQGHMAMNEPNDTEAGPTLMLEDLQGAMEAPDFDPGMVILLLSLPAMPARECRAVPVEQACLLLDDLRTQAGLPVERIDAIKRQIDT